MTREESAQIIKRCISRSSKTITDQVASALAGWSGGFPYFLYQLGYDAFEVDSDGDIDGKDIGQGLIKNLVQFERMSFGRPYKSVEGKQKQKIVDALAEGFDTRKTALERKGSQNQKCSPVSETSRRKWDCRESGQTLSTFKRTSVHLCASFQNSSKRCKEDRDAGSSKTSEQSGGN